jgi:hypothetical protein
LHLGCAVDFPFVNLADLIFVLLLEDRHWFLLEHWPKFCPIVISYWIKAPCRVAFSSFCSPSRFPCWLFIFFVSSRRCVKSRFVIPHSTVQFPCGRLSFSRAWSAAPLRGHQDPHGQIFRFVFWPVSKLTASAQALRPSVFGLTQESRPKQSVFLLVGRASVKSGCFSCRRIQLCRIPFCRSAFAIPHAARFLSPASAPGVRASSSFSFCLMEHRSSILILTFW